MSTADESAELELSIQQAAIAPQEDGVYRVILRTSRGEIAALLHVAEGEPGAAVMVGGASGGFDGPADGIYARLGPALALAGVSTLRVHYRVPDDLDECVLDVLAAVSFLRGIGAGRVALLGHSFGGAVVIKAGTLSPAVSGVVAMSSQLHGTSNVADLAPRPLLLVHGMEDQVLEATASELLYERAQEPKRIVLYAEAGHSLVQAKDELFDLLRAWIPMHVHG
ncbi:MAG: dienelactone hydrolase family protein [Dehalococcoidia bacterium]